MSPRLLLLIALLAVFAGAAWRWEHLSTRPLHTDEAVQAWQTWQLLRGEGYRYDPVDRHGPWIYYGAAALERLRGGGATTFDDRRARTFAWLAGVATLGLVACAAYRWLGPIEAACATALLAAAPLAVLYHTYFVQEAWLALFTWGLLFTALAWLAQPRLWLALTAGALAGLMQVTKETSVLHFAALAVALAVCRKRLQTSSKPVHGSTELDAPAEDRISGRARPATQLAAAVGVAVVIYAAFYSGFGSNPEGLLDGIRTYVHQVERSGTSPHAHPFAHYVRLLWPHTAGGVRWGEPWLLTLAAAGLALGLRRSAPPGALAIAVFTGLLLLIYSVIPYKTPWLLLTPAIGFTFLAGHSIGVLARLRRWTPALAALAAVLAVGQLTVRTRLALERYPGDERNPYFYQQTPRSFEALVRRLEELAEFSPTIAVISPDHAWPLPWYLRGHDEVGYYDEPPASLAGFDVLVWDSRLPAPDRWPDQAVVELHGLRPNVLLSVVIRADLWSRWQERHLVEHPSP